ncbi:16S rRNA (guanine(966)-N(2))-methyltransferase RsmD [Saccharobesus litoralis]|uniref:Ribosomal RNA small subunit methyltransferase D n=1 Tax=Saccharobesus litoralis TaxID=2172099 RepID=A0A2S0VQW2_9ALTE|nr:16S rRNA (guanine(966)-N(2))-methyltransferase RsmD [Saccharobesus litoralis]AWB66572.1 16S rRNA (guanine(966)-N(2))-methyltransferase RsmD [Saccharobesus litoralis]
MARSRQNTKKATQSGTVRIIAGLWKGKKLAVLDSQGLRPTTDRVKETLFNWLMFDVADNRVLDCFAGSGSLGFEALSRGAAHVTLIEKDKQAARQLTQNADLLNPNALQVIHNDSLQFIAQNKQAYDLVFIDPPFRCGLAEKTIQALVDNQALNNQALVYVETEKELASPFWPEDWQLIKEKNAGQVSCRLFKVNT